MVHVLVLLFGPGLQMVDVAFGNAEPLILATPSIEIPAPPEEIASPSAPVAAVIDLSDIVSLPTGSRCRSRSEATDPTREPSVARIALADHAMMLAEAAMDTYRRPDSAVLRDYRQNLHGADLAFSVIAATTHAKPLSLAAPFPHV